MNPPSTGGQPPSFKTNVNRAKTKRWVEAKSYSYDGDDWGEVDDYDEYGGYDDPPPSSKPTGLRQQGQSATQSPSGAYANRPDVYQSPVDKRQPEYREVSGSSFVQPHHGNKGGLQRSDSFRRGDERRAFSAGGPEQGILAQGNGSSYQPQAPQGESGPTRFSEMEGINRSQPSLASHADYPYGQQHLNQQVQHQPNPHHQPFEAQGRLSMGDQSQSPDQAYSAGGKYKGISHSDQPRHASMGNRALSMTSNISSQDFHNRRDFTPSAVPPPLQTRGSPSPQSASDSQSSARHPPRKDSLSQHGPTSSPYLSQPAPTHDTIDPIDERSLVRARAGSNTAKPLPFVRPADIYKRMQEEKEKEKLSLESPRPTMDAITGREAIPTSADAEISSSNNLGKGPMRRNSFEASNDRDTTHHSRLTLDPVKERKSEYGLKGFSANNPPTSPQDVPLDFTSTETEAQASQSGHPSTLKPVLPDVTRMSGFGESFLETLSPQKLQPIGAGDSPTQLSPQTPKPDEHRGELQHQPSVGFRSIVNQAFDTPEDQVPPTPSSTADSAIDRSASGGTSVVSPINISRESSAAAMNMDTKESNARPMTPTSSEAHFKNDRPEGSSSDSLGTPRQIAGKAHQSQRSRFGPTEPKPTPFIPGHRRDLSTPSPDNSPARTPALDSTQHLRQPQEAELAMVTPVESNFPIIQSLQATETEPEGPADPTMIGPRNIVTDLTKSTSSVMEPPILQPDTSRRSRPESPGSSRVRDLAGRFESGNSSPHGSERSFNQRGNVHTLTNQNDTIAESRPAVDHIESFRPRLPGGWESFASNAPSVTPKRQEIFPKTEQQAESYERDLSRVPNGNSTTVSTVQDTASSDMSATTERDKQNLAESSKPDPLTDPFSAMAAAGTALAGAFTAAVSMENKDRPDSTIENTPASEVATDTPRNFQTGDHSRSPTNDTDFRPEASKPLIPMLDDDAVSSVAPTPLSKYPPQALNEQAGGLEYFPPIIPLKPRPGSYINIDEPAAVYQRPPMPPSLSTDTGSQFESDRLRREIVKNLDPAQSSEPTTAESDSPWQDDSRLSANPSLLRQGHESAVLPSEYDSYWNGSSNASSRTNSAHDHIGAAVAVQRHDGASLVGIAPPFSVGSDHRNQRTLDDSPVDSRLERPSIPQRFSWERSLDDPAVAPGMKTQKSVIPNTPRDLASLVSHQNAGSPVELPISFEHSEDTLNGSKEAFQGQDLTAERSSDRLIENQSPDALMLGAKNASNMPSERMFGNDNIVSTESSHLPSYPGGLEVVEPGLGRQQTSPTAVGYHDRMGPGELSSPHQDYVQTPELPSHSNDIRSDRDPEILPPPPPPSDPPKFPAFREILALKNPTDRIRTFNETRNQFAHLNTGLSQWLDVKIQEIPEHAHLLSNQGRFAAGPIGHGPSPSRSKILGLRAAGSPSTQQPYYQQYLNATSQPAASESSPISTYQDSTLPQGFSPSGGSAGKLSSQQVQAKGKDLLHTAGVFGGKANVAAKGLFSKGKNRLKGSGGADKV